MASNKQVASLAAAPYIPQSPPFPSSLLLHLRGKKKKKKNQKSPPPKKNGKKSTTTSTVTTFPKQ